MAKVRNYVNNKDLTQAIAEYQKDCRRATRNKLPTPSMPNYVGECILQICNRLTRGKSFDFSGHSYRDEMVADAIERSIYAVMKFNPKRSSSGAFSYLTTVAINAMKKRINDERRQNYTKHKFFQTQFMIGDIEGMSPDEKSDKVISDFEERAAAKKLLTTQAKKHKIRK
jgi:hypothetical protein